VGTVTYAHRASPLALYLPIAMTSTGLRIYETSASIVLVSGVTIISIRRERTVRQAMPSLATFCLVRLTHGARSRSYVLVPPVESRYLLASSAAHNVGEFLSSTSIEFECTICIGLFHRLQAQLRKDQNYAHIPIAQSLGKRSCTSTREHYTTASGLPSV